MAPACTNVFQGSFTIQNTIDVATISPYCEITGDLTIKAAGVTTISLPLLQKVGGLLDGPTIPDLVSVSLPALTSASRVTFHGAALATVQLPKLTTVTTILELIGGPLSTVDVAAFQSGDVTIHGTGVSANVSLPDMISGSAIILTSGSVSAPSLASSGVVNISAKSIDLSALATADHLTAYTPTAGVSLPMLTAVTQSAWLWTAGVASAPKLVSIGGGLILRGPSAVDLPKLEIIGGNYTNTNFAFVLEGSTLATLDLPSLKTIKGNALFGGNMNCSLPNTGLTQLQLPSLISAGDPNLKVDGASCFDSSQCCSAACVGGKCGGDVNGGIAFFANPVLPKCRADALVAQLQCGTKANVVQACGGLAAGPCP